MSIPIPKPPQIRKIRDVAGDMLGLLTIVVFGMFILIFIFMICAALAGCSMRPSARIVVEENEVTFYTDRPTQMSYKEAVYDSRQPSLLRSVIEGAMVREVNKDN